MEEQSVVYCESLDELTL